MEEREARSATAYTGNVTSRRGTLRVDRSDAHMRAREENAVNTMSRAPCQAHTSHTRDYRRARTTRQAVKRGLLNCRREAEENGDLRTARKRMLDARVRHRQHVTVLRRNIAPGTRQTR